MGEGKENREEGRGVGEWLKMRMANGCDEVKVI